MRKLKLLMVTLAMIVGGVNCAWAQNWTSGAEVSEGEFYLYNIGADRFLNNGTSWVTHSVVDGQGLVLTISLKDGKYRLHSGVSGGAGPYVWGDWMNNDNGNNGWFFSKVNCDGYTNAYTLQQTDQNGTYLYWGNNTGAWGNEVFGSGATANGKNSYWLLIPKSTRQNYGVATPSSPLDVTYLIGDPDFEKRVSNDNNSTAKDGSGQTSTFWTCGGFYRKYSNEPVASGIFFEKWSGSGLTTADKIYQSPILPAGSYRLTVNAISRCTQAYLYAGSSETQLSSTVGKYSVNFFVSSEGAVELGVKIKEGGEGDWVAFDNVRLYYLGNDMTSKITNPGFDTNGDGWTSVGTVGNSETEFYNKTDGFDMYQDLTGLSAGIYALEAQGFYRNGAGIDEKRAKAQENLIAFLYAKGEGNVERSTALLSIYEEAGKMTANGSLFGDIPNWMSQAQNFISAGYYSDNKVIVEVGSAGTLRIGAKKIDGISNDWTILDNFTLTKLNYSTIADAYAAEWASRKAEATALLSDATVLSESIQRTAVENALARNPTDMEGYIASLVSLRASVNNFKAAKYAYALYATNAAKATETYDAEATTYVNVTGKEKTTFNDAYSANVTNFSPSTNNAENYYNAAVAIGSATEAFTQESIKNNYNEYAAEVATASLLGTDITGVSAPTNSAEALTAAHTINVLNYNKVVAEEYEDVSATTLGNWTDDNVASRTSQHWDGTSTSAYFEMNSGFNNDSWTMSRSQTVSLAAGKYILKVACRVSAYAEATLSVKVGDNTISTISGHQGDNGKGITTEGVASYGDGTFANTNGRGFEWKYIPFELTETGSATLSFTAEGHAKNQYVSFTSLALLTDPKVAARTALLNKINEANAAYNNGANVGTGVFQVPTSAGTTFSDAITAAQGVYDTDNADLNDINGATTALNDALTTYQGVNLNAPDAQKRYKLNLANKGALTFVIDDAAQGGYSMPFKTAADYMAQHFTLTAVSGKTNTYTLSFEDLDGKTRYVCDGTWYNAGTGANGIRTFADGATYDEGSNHAVGEQMQALEIQIQASSTEGVFYMLNTASNNAKLGANSGANDGFYTTDTNCNWSIAEASLATVNVSIASGVKYGTRIFPFTPSLSDVTFYSCEASEGNLLTLSEVSEPAANTPYILYAENDLTITELNGWGTAAAESYTTGWLTGVYTATTAPVGSYVLQKNNDKVGFYKVVDGEEPTVGANRCYLSKSSEARVAFFFDDETTTAIEAVDALTSDNVEIFNAAGTKVPALQKGMNIIKKADGTSYKVMVK